MKKRHIYKTNVYILSEEYMNENNSVDPYLKTEVEVLVVPNFRLGYATDILTGIKIPIAKEVQRFYFDDFLGYENSYLDKNGNPLSYFVREKQQKILYGLFSEKKNYLQGTLATKDDILSYRKKHPNKKQYTKALEFIFDGFDERIESIQTQKKYWKKSSGVKEIL